MAEAQRVMPKQARGANSWPAPGIGWRAAGANLQAGMKSAIEAAISAEEEAARQRIEARIPQYPIRRGEVGWTSLTQQEAERQRLIGIAHRGEIFQD